MRESEAGIPQQAARLERAHDQHRERHQHEPREQRPEQNNRKQTRRLRAEETRRRWDVR
jgi:hypothetical protein